MPGRERCSVHGKNEIKTKATPIDHVNIYCQRKWRRGRMKVEYLLLSVVLSGL